MKKKITFNPITRRFAAWILFLSRGGIGVGAYACNIGLGTEENLANHVFNSFNQNSAQTIRALIARSILFQRKNNMKEFIYVGCIVDIFPIEVIFFKL